MKTGENSHLTFCVESSNHTYNYPEKKSFCSIWNVNRTFQAVKLGLYLPFGYHGHSYS